MSSTGRTEQERRGLGRRLRDGVTSVEFLTCVGLAVATMVITVVLLRLWAWDLNIPQGATGDFNLAGMIVKGIQENGQYLTNHALGWPLGMQLYDLPIGDDNANLALMTVISWFTPNFALTMNIFMLLTFPMVAVCAYLAVRRLGVSRVAAVMVGLLYTFLPYHFRAEVFLLLIGYWALPFALLLAIRVFQGVPLFARRDGVSGARGWFSRRTVATLLTVAAIGSTGLYLAAFAFVLILAASVVQLLTREGRRTGVGGTVACVLIAVVIVVNVSPSIIYRRVNGTNPEVAYRGPQESEIYGLTLTRMVFPPTNHHFGPAREFAQDYASTTNLQYAGEQSSYLGVVSVAGLAGLLALGLTAMTRGVSPGRRRRYGPLAAGCIVAIAFGLVGGLNTIFSYAVTPVLRGTGRISVAIGFLTLVAVAYGLDALNRRMLRRGVAAWAFPVIVAGVTLVGIYDQSGTDLKPSWYRYVETSWRSTGDFVAAIEKTVPPGTALYSLPEQLFPESPGPNKLADYDGARAYLHSNRLKWSFGAVRNRQGRWLFAMQQSSDISWKLRRVSACGFGGVWLDRDGYADPVPVSATLRRLTGAAPVIGEAGRSEFYSLAAYNRRLARTTTPKERARICALALNPLELIDGRGGVGKAETDGVTNWRMIAPDSMIRIRSDVSQPRPMVFKANLTTTATAPTPVTLTGPDGARVEKVLQPGVPTTVRLPTTLPPKAGDIRISAGPGAPPFIDARRAIRLQNVSLQDAGD